MNYFLYILLFTTSIFSNTVSDSIAVENKIIIPEINIYGGLDENSISTNIEVIKNDEFNNNGKNDFQDLIQSNTSLHYAGGTSRAKYFQIRGLGELSQFSGEGPPHFYIGYIVDNIDFSGIGMIGQLYDMKQIEIFKGPQSSVYGPNAMAGVINLVSNKPSIQKSFNFNTSIYSNNGQTLNASASIPITKKLLSRITISKNYTDGFIKNLSDIEYPRYDSNAKDETLVRYQLTYNPNTSLSFNIVSYYMNLDNKYDVWTPDNNGFITYSDFQGYDKQKANAISINTKYISSNTIFTSITTFSKNDINYSYDGDWANNDFWADEPYNWNSNNPYYWGPWQFIDITKRERISYSQEFRIKKNIFNSLTIISGLFISKTKEIDRRDGWLFAGYANNIDSKFDIFNYAIYTQISYPLSNKLILSSTLRYDINDTKQDLEYEYYDIYYNILQGEYQNQITDNNLLGGTIKAIYQHNDFLFINSSISRGYKTSGINQSQAPFLADSLSIYDTEYCNNLDFGIHYQKDNYKFILSAFYMYRYNPQLRLSYQVNPADPTSFDYATFNANHGYNYGFDLNITLKASELMTLNTYVSYLKTHVSNFEYLGTLYGNRELSHTPEHKYGIHLNYDLSEFINGLTLNMESNFISSFYFEEQNNIKSDPYHLMNLSLNYKDRYLEISLWSKNITDTQYPIRGYQFVLDPTYEVKSYQSFGDPRTTGVTLNFNF